MMMTTYTDTHITIPLYSCMSKSYSHAVSISEVIILSFPCDYQFKIHIIHNNTIPVPLNFLSPVGESDRDGIRQFRE